MRLEHGDGGVRPGKAEGAERAAVERGFHYECHERCDCVFKRLVRWPPLVYIYIHTTHTYTYCTTHTYYTHTHTHTHIHTHTGAGRISVKIKCKSLKYPSMFKKRENQEDRSCGILVLRDWGAGWGEEWTVGAPGSFCGRWKQSMP